MAGITLSYKQIGAICLVLANLILVGPGTWILKTLWDQANTFKTDTELQLEQLDEVIGSIHVKMAETCVTRNAFNQYRQQMDENIRYLDSKLLKEPYEHQNH